MKHLDGKVAIVTGSGQGIGRGIAIYLAREGAKVITNNRKPNGASIDNYDKSSMPEEEWNEMLSLSGDAEGTAKTIEKEGGTAVHFYGDVSDPAIAEAIVQKATDTWGRIDIVVNNAAGLGSGSITSLTEEKWDYMTVPKMKGAFNLMHYAVPYMIEQKFGRIFNCSSDAWVGLPDNDAYSAGNAGIVGLTWAAAKELFRHGITVNAYCPQGASPGHAVEYNKMLRNVKAITGEVFSIKSSGKISRYQYPVPVTHAERPADSGFLWDVDELDDVFKKTVMGEDYVSHASKKMWG